MRGIIGGMDAWDVFEGTVAEMDKGIARAVMGVVLGCGVTEEELELAAHAGELEAKLGDDILEGLVVPEGAIPEWWHSVPKSMREVVRVVAMHATKEQRERLRLRLEAFRNRKMAMPGNVFLTIGDEICRTDAKRRQPAPELSTALLRRRARMYTRAVRLTLGLFGVKDEVRYDVRGPKDAERGWMQHRFVYSAWIGKEKKPVSAVLDVVPFELREEIHMLRLQVAGVCFERAIMLLKSAP